MGSPRAAGERRNLHKPLFTAELPEASCGLLHSLDLASARRPRCREPALAPQSLHPTRNQLHLCTPPGHLPRYRGRLPCPQATIWLPTITSSRQTLLPPPHTLVNPHPRTLRYSLVLPQGSRYHALSGPLGAEQQAQLGGLRPFRLGFNEWQRQGREGGLE